MTHQHQMFSKVPEKPSLCRIELGTHLWVRTSDSKRWFAELAAMNQQRLGSGAQRWRVDKRTGPLLYIICSRAGVPAVSTTTKRERSRPSLKCSCPAKFRFNKCDSSKTQSLFREALHLRRSIPLEGGAERAATGSALEIRTTDTALPRADRLADQFEVDQFLSQPGDHVEGDAGSEEQLQADNPQPVADLEIWEATLVALQHNHACDESPFAKVQESGGRVITSSRDPELLRVLSIYLGSLRGRAWKGSLIALSGEFVRAQLPGVVVGETTLQNAISYLQENAKDADELVKYLSACSTEGELDYFRYATDPATGSLNYAVFAPKGAKELVRKHGVELGSVDSTHKVTRYTLKTWTLVVIDSSMRTRPVLLAFLTDESISNFSSILADYMAAFRRPLPKVIFSDNDPAFSSAIVLLPNPPLHKLCLWHLIDNNIKSAVAACLPNGYSSWFQFRAELIRVRECMDMNRAQILWDDLMSLWLPESAGPKTAGARKYLRKEAFALRAKWWNSYSPEAPTLGIQATSRNEGWHVKVKSMTSIYQPLPALAKTLLDHLKIMSIKDEEEAKSNAALVRARVESLLPFGDKAVEKFLLSRSLKALDYVHEQLQQSSLLTLDDVSIVKCTCQRCQTDLFRVDTENQHEVHPRQDAVACLAAGTQFDPFTAAVIYKPSPGITAAMKESRCDVTFAKVTSHCDSFIAAVIPGDGLSRASAEANNNLQITCNCMYPSRMLLPCHHILAAARCLDDLYHFHGNQDHHGFEAAGDDRRLKLLDFISNYRKFPSESINSIVLRTTIGARWEHAVPGGANGNEAVPRMTDVAAVDGADGPFMGIPEFSMGAGGAAELDDDEVVFISERLGMSTSGAATTGSGLFRRGDLELSTSGDGTPRAYGQLLAICRSICENLTRDATDLYTGAIMGRFLSQFERDYRSLKMSVTVPEVVRSTSKLFQRATEAAFADSEAPNAPLLCSDPAPMWLSRDVATNGGEIYSWAREHFQNRDKTQKATRMVWEEKHLVPEWAHSARTRDVIGNADDDDDDDDDNDFDKDDDHHDNNENDDRRSVDGNDAEGIVNDSVSIPIVRNPPTRLGQNKRSRIQVQGAGRSRAEQERRVKRARMAPVESRIGTAKTPNIEPPVATGGGFACLFCDMLQVQKVESNVKQHMHARHRKEFDHFMKEASDMQKTLSQAMVNSASGLAERLACHPPKGTIVKVWWDSESANDTADDHTNSEAAPLGAWHRGKVLFSGARSLERLTHIKYDDGDEASHDFTRDDEKWVRISIS